MDKVYLVRQIFLVDDFGSIRIDEEAIFSDEKAATDYMHSLVDLDADEVALARFRNSISIVKLNDVESWSSTDERIYSIKGKQLEHLYPGEYFDSNTLSQEYFENFEAGEVVRVEPKLENPKSFSVLGTTAVVASCEGDECLVYLVGDSGFVRHEHVKRALLVRVDAELNEENILFHISQYFQGASSSLGKDPDGILNGKYYVGDTFSTACILDK